MEKVFGFALVMVFSMVCLAKGRVHVDIEERCEVARANVFEEALKEPKSGVPYMDGKFLSLALRQEAHQVRSTQLKSLDRDLKKQVGLSLGSKNLKNTDFQNVDNGVIHTFQWSNAAAPHDWYQVVYYYNDDKVSGFVYVMNTNIVAARIIDGELSICDAMFRVR